MQISNFTYKDIKLKVCKYSNKKLEIFRAFYLPLVPILLPPGLLPYFEILEIDLKLYSVIVS